MNMNWNTTISTKATTRTHMNLTWCKEGCRPHLNDTWHLHRHSNSHNKVQKRSPQQVNRLFLYLTCITKQTRKCEGKQIHLRYAYDWDELICFQCVCVSEDSAVLAGTPPGEIPFYICMKSDGCMSVRQIGESFTEVCLICSTDILVNMGTHTNSQEKACDVVSSMCTPSTTDFPRLFQAKGLVTIRTHFGPRNFLALIRIPHQDKTKLFITIQSNLPGIPGSIA